MKANMFRFITYVCICMCMLYIHIYMNVLPVCIICTTCVSALRGQKKSLDSLKLELGTIESHYVGDWDLNVSSLQAARAANP